MVQVDKIGDEAGCANHQVAIGAWVGDGLLKLPTADEVDDHLRPPQFEERSHEGAQVSRAIWHRQQGRVQFQVERGGGARTGLHSGHGLGQCDQAFSGRCPPE